MVNHLLFRVGGMPQGKARARFTKSGHSYTPAQTRRYEQAIKAAALAKALTCGWLKSDEPIRIQIGAYFAIPRSFSKSKRAAAQWGNLYPTVKPDADNIAKVVCDALNEVAYNDDKQIVECVVRKRYCTAYDEPHVVVSVERMPTFDEMKAAALSATEQG